MLPVSAQREGISMESQAGLPYLQGVGAELTDQAEKAALQGKVQSLERP